MGNENKLVCMFARPSFDQSMIGEMNCAIIFRRIIDHFVAFLLNHPLQNHLHFSNKKWLFSYLKQPFATKKDNRLFPSTSQSAVELYHRIQAASLYHSEI